MDHEELEEVGRRLSREGGKKRGGKGPKARAALTKQFGPRYGQEPVTAPETPLPPRTPGRGGRGGVVKTLGRDARRLPF